MKRSRSIFLLLIVSGIHWFSHTLGFAEAGKSLSMVFDPTSKKYFVGGEAKFVIRQAEQSSLVDRVEVSIDGGNYVSYDGAIRFTEEGKHTLKFRAISPVNNWAPVQFTEVFVDLTPPSTKPIFSELRYFKDDETLYAAVNSVLTLQAQDNLSGVSGIEFSHSGETYTNYSEPILIEKYGRQALFIRSRDRVGNVETARSLEFVADGTAPQSKLNINGKVKPSIINGQSYLTASDSVSFSIDAIDPQDHDGASGIKAIWVKVDGGDKQAYQKPIYFLKEGPHRLEYYAEDNVGNKEELKTLSVYTVSTPPRTFATAHGNIVNTGGVNFSTRNFKLILTARDNIVGLDRIEIRVDNQREFQTYLEPVRFSNPGLHRIDYRAVDRAGNLEPTRTYSVFIQTEPPETSIETAQPLVIRDGLIYSPSPNIITMNVKNKGVGVAKTLYSLNDGPLLNYNGPITITARERLFKITYKSIDKLGNEEKNKTVTYHMIGSSPVVDLFVSDGQSHEEKLRTKYFEKAAQETPPQNAPYNPQPSAFAPPVENTPSAFLAQPKPTVKQPTRKPASKATKKKKRKPRRRKR